MSESLVRLAIARLTTIALFCIVGLVGLTFAPSEAETSTVSTVLSTALVGSVTAVAGIVQLSPRQSKV